MEVRRLSEIVVINDVLMREVCWFRMSMLIFVFSYL